MGSVFPDPRLVAAIVDRVTVNAHILENRHAVLPTKHQQDESPQASELTTPSGPRCRAAANTLASLVQIGRAGDTAAAFLLDQIALFRHEHR
jgi:hypothetical protein